MNSSQVVLFDGDPTVIGSIVDVEIDKSAALTLFGKLAGKPVAV